MSSDRQHWVPLQEVEALLPPKQERHALWYVQSLPGRGPFPTGAIQSFLILGRLKPESQVSRDQQSWQSIDSVPGLLPPELASDDFSAQARLERRRQFEDERKGRDRRDDDRPQRGDRRQHQTPAVQQLELQRTEVQELDRARAHWKRWPLMLGFSAVVLAGLLLVLIFGESIDREGGNCKAAPAPGVNWSRCYLANRDFSGAHLSRARIENSTLTDVDFSHAVLSGARLTYTDLSGAQLKNASLRGARLYAVDLSDADLSGANLNGADLSYADLRGARISGAFLEGAKLARAIWIDGRECADDSVSRCERP